MNQQTTSDNDDISTFDLQLALRMRPQEFFEPFFICKLQKAP